MIGVVIIVVYILAAAYGFYELRNGGRWFNHIRRTRRWV